VAGFCTRNFLGILVISQGALILALGYVSMRSLGEKQSQDELHQRALDTLERQKMLYEKELELYYTGEKKGKSFYELNEPYQPEEYKTTTVDWVDKFCDDLADHKQCRGWAEIGECEKNYFGMIHHCPKACGHCEKFRQREDRKLEWIPSSSIGIGLQSLPQTIVLSWQPRAFLWPNFLSDHEIERVKSLAQHKLQQSTVVTHQKGVRTSFGSDMTGLMSHDPVVAAIEARIARALMLPASYQEPMQILRYESDQFYNPHPDFYDDLSIKKFNPEAGNRAITVLMYLSDVEEGGQTEFPKGIPAVDLDSEEARMLNITKVRTCKAVGCPSVLSMGAVA